MSTKRHPADADIPGGFISNDKDILPVKVDAPVSTGKEEPTPKPSGGTERVPGYEPPAPRPGKQLEGSDPGRTGAGHDLPPASHDPIDGF